MSAPEAHASRLGWVSSKKAPLPGPGMLLLLYVTYTALLPWLKFPLSNFGRRLL